MALENYKIRQIDYSTAMAVIVREHYLHRKAPCSVAFGLFLGDDLKGVVCYGTPSSAPLRSGIAGPEHACNVAELTRLWVCDSVPRNGESYLIGRTVGKAGKEIVVSFAEIQQGHVGIVYQATNWIYTGLSAKRTNWTIDGMSKHCQTLADKYTASEIRAEFGDRFSLQDRPRKHRYVFINAKGRRRAEIFASLRYRPEPYPKAPNIGNLTTKSHAKYHRLAVWCSHKNSDKGRKMNERKELIARLRLDYTASKLALTLMHQAADMLEADVEPKCSDQAPQLQRPMLTDAEITQLANMPENCEGDYLQAHPFARAIEKKVRGEA